VVKERCGDARTASSASAIEGEITALSDIDILVICNLDKEERVRLKSEIYRRNHYHPLGGA